MADRVPISHIADMVGISRRFVYKWAQRFLQEGIAGLTDKPGRGRRAESGVVQVTANASMTSDV
jgi:transposase